MEYLLPMQNDGAGARNKVAKWSIGRSAWVVLVGYEARKEAALAPKLAETRLTIARHLTSKSAAMEMR